MGKLYIPFALAIVLGSGLLYYLFNYVSPINITTNTPKAHIVGLFLATLLVVLTSILTLVIYIIRKRFSPYTRPKALLNTSLRQGALIATGLILVLFLSLIRVLNIATVGSAILTLILIEWYSR